ncbi:MAG: sulfatase [Saprospiraceae bacterium]|nr:sulfatase [Saprospiraceae bacterium]
MVRLLLFVVSILSIQSCVDRKVKESPNFLVLLSDNHYYEHLSCYGDAVVRTPHIDSIAEKGVRFTQAFCASPSCTPARAAMLTGQDIWRLGQGANLWSTLADDIPTYTDLLEGHGYLVGHDRKGWGPGNFKAGGRTRNPAGHTFKDFATFLEEGMGERPWSYLLSSRNPHRPFEYGKGVDSGMDLSKVRVPPYLPDDSIVRADICDYYYQIQAFDVEVGEALALLRDAGQLERTIIIICGDNGWMMPRGLANLYDFGTRVPLVISWPAQFPARRVVTDLVSLNDIAPMILQVAGVSIPEEMNARSLLPLLTSQQQGKTSFSRSFLVMARERHAICRQGGLGYPGRAIRTDSFLYIENLFPDRWPAGDPPLFGDIDLHMLQGKSPTKEYMMLNKDDPKVRPLYELAFMKRPLAELYNLKKDPFQMKNVAASPTYSNVKRRLKEQLWNYLQETKDPRALGKSVTWDTQPYYKERDWIGRPRPKAQQLFGLEEAYPYR